METGETLNPQTKDNPSVSVKEIPLSNGDKIKLPALHVARMSLFHGSSLAEIKTLEIGDQLSIGRGIYLTPTKETAEKYAKSRSNDLSIPTVYEAEITDADIADLRTREAQEHFAKLHKQSLLDWEQNVLPNLKGPSEEVTKMIKEQRKKAVSELVKKIDANSWAQLRDITFGWADLVSRTLSSKGFKGLMSIEGEPPEIDFHDSVVIFNPQDVKLVNKERVA